MKVSEQHTLPFWIEMSILFGLTLPVMWLWAMTKWSILMPIGFVNLVAATVMIAIVNRVRRSMRAKKMAATGG